MMKPGSLVAVSSSEACSVFGGKQDHVGKILETIAAGVGLFCKFIWNIMQSIKDTFFPPEVAVL